LALQILTGTRESLGTSILKSRGLFVQAKWYWIGLGALIGYIFVFNGLWTAAFTYFKCMLNFFCALHDNCVNPANLSGDAPSKLYHQKRVMNDSQSSVNNRRVALPFAPLSLTFDNIRYSVDMQEVKQHALIYISISSKQ
jgi:hypothetical protein